jgi:ankyrin repeat protein
MGSLKTAVFSVSLVVALAPHSFANATTEGQEQQKRKAEAQFIEDARWCKTDSVRKALETGVDVNARDADGVSAIRWAAVEGLEPIVVLLIEAGADVNSANSSGVTPLMMAARWGYKGIVKALVAAGAEVDSLSSTGPGRTALMYAAICGHDSIVDLLLKADADPSIKDRDGRTASKLAKHWGRDETARMLLAAEENKKSAK